MSTTIPLRIDSNLVHRARSSGALLDRTPTAQIEHWAKLGLVLEPVLSGKSITRVKQTAPIQDLAKVVEFSQTEEGQKRVAALIHRYGNPVYEADPKNPELVIERSPDGTTRRGHFINRRFEPVSRRKKTPVGAGR